MGEIKNLGLRNCPGTVIVSSAGKIIHNSPGDEEEIQNLMANLIDYLNNNYGLDPLIKVAIIHHQFKTIHPFYHGNGRIGRILMVLMLIHSKRLDYPTLFLSGYILEYKSDYYKLSLKTGAKYLNLLEKNLISSKILNKEKVYFIPEIIEVLSWEFKS